MRNLRGVARMCLIGAWLFGAGKVLAQEPEPRVMATPERLAPPVMPADPSQADQGALVYYYICMACHGDRGQGLTDEFRSLWAPGDQNCWQRKCHGANHPPNGFELVSYVPPVIGEQTLARSLSPQELHSYVSTAMPWHDPGRLSDEEYWQLTAFLLRENGMYDGEEPLGPGDATNAPEETPDREATDLASATPAGGLVNRGPRLAIGQATLVGLGAVFVVAVGWAILRASRHRER